MYSLYYRIGFHKTSSQEHDLLSIKVTNYRDHPSDDFSLVHKHLSELNMLNGPVEILTPSNKSHLRLILSSTIPLDSIIVTSLSV
ncbi:hypothetical protein CEXT_273301 [Caerostris extrusa]|uniref:Uncharacterized protein n=1 Tax=Caerostris extrusa TaxID=172846 RepID=A0AAV4WML2_CAEEX|nr:hypothetical protein CEXT_273301 [Caerostris extrusa]